MTTVQAATLVAPYELEVRDYPFPAALEPGAGRVYAIDPSQKRLDVAARVAGAEPADAEELRNVDLVVNATGFPGSFGKAIRIVRDGGTIIEVGAFVTWGRSRSTRPCCGGATSR